MKASELFQERPVLKVLLYGDSGSGKTTWASRSPRPFVALSEPQGLASIVAVAPDADVELIGTTPEFDELMGALVKGELSHDDGCLHFRFRDEDRAAATIIVDSFSDLHEATRKYHTKKNGDVRWGDVQEDMGTYLRDLRAIPVNVVCICLADEAFDDQKRRRVWPMLFGQLARRAGQFFNAVGYCQVVENSNGVEHGVAWRRGSVYVTKPAPRWPTYTPCDLDTPGKVTLGSLLAYSYPTFTVLIEEGDDASLVEQSEVEPKTEETKPTTRTRRTRK